MTTSAFPILTDVENAFKMIVWTPLVKSGEVWIEGQAPFLALPVIRNMEEGLVNLLTDALFNWLVTQIDVAAIVLVNAERQAKWSSANEKLAIIAADSGVDSDAYKKALADAAADFALMVHRGP